MTTTQFGPQLIGETEKTLNALLVRILAGRLTEPQWVTLRVAHLDEDLLGSSEELAARVADRARFDDATRLVEGLTAAGLLADGRPTDEGRALVAQVQAEISAGVGAIWQDLAAEDVAAASRVLSEVRDRARALLA